jgi:hypothetical protein
VTSSNPISGSQTATISTAGVTGKKITANFSLAMNAATIDTTTFYVAPTGGIVLPATVSYNAVTQVATLETSSALLTDTSYTAVITTDVKSAAGIPISCSYAWSFKTGAASAPITESCAAGNLPLGSAATFGVLAGTVFTVANPTSVTGDVGSPSIIPAVGPSTLIGTKYDTASGSLPLIAAAVTDMQTGVACANGRACDVNYGAIDLGGLSLGPGVYCATGAINITGILSLNAPGVYIFRTANTFNTAANAIVQFTGTATAANASVYWVPVGATTLGANTTFIGNIMAFNAAITVSAVSTVASGSALSGSAVTVNTSTIAIP